MTKRHVEYLLAMEFAILKDCESIFPADCREFDRDRSRLTSLVEERGMAIFTIDFPAVLKHLDKCLSDGAYIPSGLPHTRRHRKGSTIPRLFRGLYLRIFDDSGVLRSEPDINAISCLRQLYAFAKKYRVDCKQENVFATVSEFAEVDEDLPDPTCCWDNEVLGTPIDLLGLRLDDQCVRTIGSSADRVTRPAIDPELVRRCEEIFSIVSASLGSFDPWEWRPKHGPGAVSDLMRDEYKYTFPHWSPRLETVFPYADFAFANYSNWVDSIASYQPKEDDYPSKLIAVPKTQKGPRLIAAEPTAHQWCQQILWDYFGSRCRQTWIGSFVHFRDQSYNQRLARLASEHGSHWTVDLSAASDRVSLWLVERVFKTNLSLLNALHSSRTRFLDQKIDKKTSHRIKLKKFSTMGSACTFPVESIIFLSIAIAAVLFAENRGSATISKIRRLTGRIQVFGDDIIIPSTAGEALEDLLGYLFFKVNQTKTHRNGRFRESCGLEAYAGHDVTPSYLLKIPNARKPESIISCVETSNNFHRKGWWHAAEYIRSTVTWKNIFTVSVGSGTFGWQSFVGPVVPRQIRENQDLCRTECRGTVIKARCQRTPAEGYGPLLQYFVEAPDPDLPWVSGATGRPRLKLRLGWVPLGELG